MQIQMQILLEATLLVYFLNHTDTLKIMTCILEKQWNYFKPMEAFSSLTKLAFQINSEHIANVIFPLQWSFRGNLADSWVWNIPAIMENLVVLCMLKPVYTPNTISFEIMHWLSSFWPISHPFKWKCIYLSF